MQHFFILNESTDKSVAGDVNFFSSVESLIGSIEAIDVKNGEYFCFTSDGREVTLRAMNTDSPITVTTEAQPRHRIELESVLRAYLLWLVKNGKIKGDINYIETANLTNLVDSVPRSLIR